MKKFFIFLFVTFVSYFQSENYLDSILNLETKISKEQFLDTILKIEYDKALIDTKKYLDLVDKAEKIALISKDKKQIAKAYTAKALAFHFSSKFDLSIEYTLKSIKIYRELNDSENYAILYTDLGWRIKNRDLKKSLYYMNKGIKTLEKKNPRSLKLSGAYNNYGVLQQRNNQLDSAFYFHKKSLTLSIQQKDSISIPFAQTHIGELFIKKKDYIKAEKYFLNALEIRKNRNDIYGITDSYLYLGDLFYAKKEYKKAISYFQKGELLAIKNSYFPLKKYATEYIYKSYENLNDFKSAFLYQKKFTHLKDSILNKNTNSKIAELEVKFQTTEKEKEINKQKEQLLVQELAIKNRNLYAILLTSALLIIAVIFWGIYRRNQFKRRQLQKEIDLKSALATIKTQNRLQEQRLRISRDLHDNIGSQLTFIISSVDNLKYISKDTNEKLKEKLSSISSFAGDTISQLRDTIWAMNKNEISVEDLHARILSFVEKAKSVVTKTQFEVTYDIDKNKYFPSFLGMNIFRVIQESINNSIKYANASKIEVQISKKEDNFLVLIIDNGIGFDKNTVELGSGLGNIEKRASEINGAINIKSKKNKGTIITLKVNLKNTANDV